VTPSAPVQLVSVAPLDAHFADGVDIKVMNSGKESDSAASETRLTNGDAAISGECKDKKMNGVCKSDSFQGDGVSEVVAAAVDTNAESRSAAVVDTEKTVGGGLLVFASASPVTKPACNTRRRRSMPTLPHTSEPAAKLLRRATTRHMSSDQLLTRNAAADSDNLPSFLSSMTDDE